MKLALIDPNACAYFGEWVGTVNPMWRPIPIPNSQRVCEVVSEGDDFPIAPPLNWQECPEEVVADQWYFDSNLEEFIQVPPVPPLPASE